MSEYLKLETFLNDLINNSTLPRTMTVHEGEEFFVKFPKIPLCHLTEFTSFDLAIDQGVTWTEFKKDQTDDGVLCSAVKMKATQVGHKTIKFIPTNFLGKEKYENVEPFIVEIEVLPVSK